MRSILRTVHRLLSLAAFAAAGGCAAFSNPTTHGSIPVRRIPEDVLGKPRDEQIDLPQVFIKQPPVKDYIIDEGDILGLVIPGVLGSENQPPPITPPQPGSVNNNIGIGYPYPVLEDGTVILPLLPDPVTVRGMTLAKANEAVKKAYLDKEILKPGNVRLQVTLYRPRQYKVVVVRQDSGNQSYANNTFGAYGGFSAKRGSGIVLDLSAYENDVLTALTRSGGLPGNDAKNEVIIQRCPKAIPDIESMPSGPIPGVKITRIPLRLRPGEPINFTPEDIILKDGDIVFVQSRDTEVYYTGGLIPPGEYPIPRDYDLDVVNAILQVRGPLVNGGQNINNLSGALVGSGLGAPSPSQLTVIRKCPGNRQISIRVDLNRALQDRRERILVQPGDVLVLQETLGEAMTRYLTGVIRYNIVAPLNKANPFITTTANFP